MLIKTDSNNRLPLGKIESSRIKFEPDSYYQVEEIGGVIVLVPVKVFPETNPEALDAVRSYVAEIEAGGDGKGSPVDLPGLTEDDLDSNDPDDAWLLGKMREKGEGE